MWILDCLCILKDRSYQGLLSPHFDDWIANLDVPSHKAQGWVGFSCNCIYVLVPMPVMRDFYSCVLSPNYLYTCLLILLILIHTIWAHTVVINRHAQQASGCYEICDKNYDMKNSSDFIALFLAVSSVIIKMCDIKLQSLELLSLIIIFYCHLVCSWLLIIKMLKFWNSYSRNFCLLWIWTQCNFLHS